MSTQQILNMLSHFSVFALLALSFAIPHRVLGFINVSHAIPFLIAPYTVLLLSRLVGGAHSFFIGLLALLVAAGSGIILSAFFTLVRSLRPTPLVLLLSSLGLYTAFQNALSLAFGNNPVSLRGLNPTWLCKIGTGILTQWQLIIIGSAVAATVIWAFISRCSRFGNSYRAVADNMEVAVVSGVAVQRVGIIAAFIGSSLAGLAGILTGYDTAVDPEAGLQAMFMAIIVAVAGRCRVGGIWLISMLIVVTQTLGTTRTSSMWQNALAFGVLLFAILLRDVKWRWPSVCLYTKS